MYMHLHIYIYIMYIYIQIMNSKGSYMVDRVSSRIFSFPTWFQSQLSLWRGGCYLCFFRHALLSTLLGPSVVRRKTFCCSWARLAARRNGFLRGTATLARDYIIISPVKVVVFDQGNCFQTLYHYITSKIPKP